MSAGEGYLLLEYDVDRVEPGDEHWNYSREKWMPHGSDDLIYQQKIHHYPMRRKIQNDKTPAPEISGEA